MAKPDFDLMWKNFPDHTLYPTLKSLFSYIGGTLVKNIDVPGFGPNGNTCAVRISRALNYGVMPISYKLIKSLDLHTMTGGDRMLYLFRVREMRVYLANALGVRPTTVTKDFDKAFAGSRGLVAFDVSGWSDASGHVALWNGTTFKEPDHDDFRGRRDDPKTPQHEPQVESMMLWPL